MASRRQSKTKPKRMFKREAIEATSDGFASGYGHVIESHRVSALPEEQTIDRYHRLKEYAQSKTSDEIRFVVDSPAYEKMSVVLEDFFEPYRDRVVGLKDLNDLAMIATLAWNASFQSSHLRMHSIDDALSKKLLPGSFKSAEEVRSIFEALVERKFKMFGPNNRKIVAFEVTDTGCDFRIKVVSTLDAPSSGLFTRKSKSRATTPTARRPWRELFRTLGNLLFSRKGQRSTP